VGTVIIYFIFHSGADNHKFAKALFVDHGEHEQQKESPGAKCSACKKEKNKATPEKICASCNQAKSKGEFSKKQMNKAAYLARCKPCVDRSLLDSLFTVCGSCTRSGRGMIPLTSDNFKLLLGISPKLCLSTRGSTSSKRKAQEQSAPHVKKNKATPEKICASCNQAKSEGEFSEGQRKKAAYLARCKPCVDRSLLGSMQTVCESCIARTRTTTTD
jgi:hypothetical protein